MDQNALIQFLPLVLIFVVFYFLLIRPQQKKQKDHRAMLEALRRGDRIVTGGGFFGTVSKVVSPEEVEVDLAPNVRVRVLRSTITSVLAKPDPAAAREAAKERDAAQGNERKGTSPAHRRQGTVIASVHCVLERRRNGRPNLIRRRSGSDSVASSRGRRVNGACCISRTGRSS